ncbi:hypothetical protein BDV29DRAFT_201262 [Aspergillus leporis]|jgi:hypothetical protein|uniref:P68 RBP/TagC-like beta-propeller domain-containing protein n=1 Tax=Aspergillus leporis TaxID=41062 RepID=A0A5N5X515_9EURO|nr:hypothetical protein BDV29DRAFT_201262 [Aspergillus leporis]
MRFTTRLLSLFLVFGTHLVLAALPPSRRFDLTKPSYDLFRSKALAGATVQQGFSFDNVNRRLFVSQRRDGSSETAGDLTITQLDFDGNIVGSMDLVGFGHGVSFAAQANGSATYLWTEVEANSNGYGKRLARFEFQHGKTLSSTSSSLNKFSAVKDATEHTCSIDPVNNRLIVRYQLDGGKRIAVYDLDAATDGDFSEKLADISHPALKTLSKTFQGYAVYGQYIYLLTGNSYDVTKGEVNSEIAAVDLNTGEVFGPTLTKAGSTLSFREPEGLAIYQTVGGEVRLFLGFASGKGGDRRSNLFYKNALV